MGMDSVMAAGGASGLQRNGDRERAQKLREACREFESVLIYQLLRQMRSASGSAFPGGGFAGGIYGGMLDWELARRASEAGGVGLADMLYRELSGDR